MSNEKPVELLTESEMDMLEAAYDYDYDSMLKVVASIVTAREIAAEQAGREDNALHDMCYVSGSKALEAREAAARREAEDDPKHARMYRALLERAEKAERAVAAARREALEEAKAWREQADKTKAAFEAERRALLSANLERRKAEAKVARVEALAERLEDRGHETVECYDVADLIRDALAEPERDEEGGR